MHVSVFVCANRIFFFIKDVVAQPTSCVFSCDSLALSQWHRRAWHRSYCIIICAVHTYVKAKLVEAVWDNIPCLSLYGQDLHLDCTCVGADLLYIHNNCYNTTIVKDLVRFERGFLDGFSLISSVNSLLESKIKTSYCLILLIS